MHRKPHHRQERKGCLDISGPQNQGNKLSWFRGGFLRGGSHTASIGPCRTSLPLLLWHLTCYDILCPPVCSKIKPSHQHYKAHALLLSVNKLYLAQAQHSCFWYSLFTPDSKVMGSSIKILSDIYKCSSCFRLHRTKGRKRERLINLKEFIINTGRISFVCCDVFYWCTHRGSI